MIGVCARWLGVLLALWGLAGGLAGSVQAQEVQLRDRLCYATAPADLPSTAASVAALPFDCRRPPPYAAYRDGWVWLKLRDAAALSNLAARWQLLSDQVGFERMAMLVVARDGSTQAVQLRPGGTAEHWAPGGVLRMTVTRPGAEVAAVYLGYRQLDHLRLMRKLTAAPTNVALHRAGLWLVLMGLFAGVILSAIASSLLVRTGRLASVHGWYLVWSVLALGYGFSWTGMVAFAVPGFAGPIASTSSYALIGALVGAATMVFLSLVEGGLLPRWLRRAGTIAAALVALAGVLAALEWPASPYALDRWLNLLFVVNFACLAAGVAIAMHRHSRVVWFYLASWTPVLVIFVLRVLRNFELLPQSDMVDMGTFVALACQAAALTLVLADRFRQLARQRDAAERARSLVAIEGEAFRRAAHTDPLTGLGNRAACHAELRIRCAVDAPFALLVVAIDNLTEVNERLGHEAGDRLLRALATALTNASPSPGCVTRKGGDKFAVLLPADGAAHAAFELAVDALQGTPVSHRGRSVAASLSSGLARWPQDARDSDELVKNANLAMRQSRREGRRQLHRYDPSLHDGLDGREILARQASRGLARGEFALYYQPVSDLGSGAPVSYEALLRWQHPERGLLTPESFGAMLNEPGAGQAIQDHVVDLALAALRDHSALLPRVAVNLIAAQLDGPPSAARLLARLERHGLDPARLCVEVTEDLVLDSTMDRTAGALHLLHDAGVRIALDDFGTGYASLIHLKHLPFDMLKIDRSFTLGLFEDDGQSEAIIRAIVGLGSGLGKQVVAEGVETERQRRRLAEMGCTLGQGYLFARPAPIQDLVDAAAGVA